MSFAHVVERVAGARARPAVRSAGGLRSTGRDGPGERPRGWAQLSVRTPVNTIEYFPPNFEGLVLGCIDADFCK